MNNEPLQDRLLLVPLVKIPKLSLKNLITQKKYIIFATEIKVHE